MKNIFYMLFFFPVFCFARSQGPFAPSSCVNSTIAGGTDWTNPGNAKVEDGITADETSATSNIDLCTGFNFSVPHHAVITGILVEFKRDSDPGKLATDYSVRIYKNSVAVGTDKANTTVDWAAGTLTWNQYGGIGDLWGTTWTSDDVNNSNFGAGLSGSKDAGGSNPFHLDATRITIYFTDSTDIEKGKIYKAKFR